MCVSVLQQDPPEEGNRIHRSKKGSHVDPPVSRFDFIHGEKRTHSNLQEQPSLLQIERDFQNFE